MIASNFITHPVRYENLGVFSLLNSVNAAPFILWLPK